MGLILQQCDCYRHWTRCGNRSVRTTIGRYCQGSILEQTRLVHARRSYSRRFETFEELGKGGRGCRSIQGARATSIGHTVTKYRGTGNHREPATRSGRFAERYPLDGKLAGIDTRTGQKSVTMKRLHTDCQQKGVEVTGPRQSPVVSICTASLKFTNSTFCPQSVFTCFVWISEQTAIISLYSIN